MRRRTFTVLGATAGVLPLPLAAQDVRKPRSVGIMARPGAQFDAFRDGMRALGYSEGVNITLHHPGTAFSFQQLAADAEALVRLGVEVIVAGGSESVQAVRNATSSIPIVMAVVGDPVELGLAQSLARPGGNVTGVSNLSLDLAGKWIELLKEIDPRIRRIAVLWNPAHPAHRNWLTRFQAVATGRIELIPLAADTQREIEQMILDAEGTRATGLVVPGSSLHLSNLARIAEFATRGKMASIAWTGAFTAAGGLVAYGASETDQFQRAAAYVDKILKGAKPGELPIEQPTRFELSINVRTAKALGLTIPPSILARADEVFE